MQLHLWQYTNNYSTQQGIYPHTNLKITSSISPSDRKFNILLYGIQECPSTQTRLQRMKSDLQNALQKLSSLNDSINANSIKDISQFRLGKYIKDQNRPRPLLIKFLRATDAFSVLANNNQLKSPVSIKPDKPPEDREIDKILLGVRWSLIQKGRTDRKSIKIRNKCLYVNNDLHGKIENGTLMENVNANTKPSSSVTKCFAPTKLLTLTVHD